MPAPVTILGDNLTEDTRIIRYMSLNSLLPLLTLDRLQFTRIDRYKNDDPYECNITEDQLGELEQTKYFKQRAEALRFIDFHRQQLAVSCWMRLGNQENYLMWRGKEVALISTVGGLRNSLKLPQSYEAWISEVRYLEDFRKNSPEVIEALNDEKDPAFGKILLALQKRKAFASEREIRVIVKKPPKGDQADPLEPYCYFSVTNVRDFLQEIRISPRLALEPEPLRKAIEILLKAKNLFIPVNDSDTLQGKVTFK